MLVSVVILEIKRTVSQYCKAHVYALKIMAQWEVDSSMHSYHAYESIWAATLGEQIGCIREPLNTWDRYVCLKIQTCLSAYSEQTSQLRQLCNTSP